MSLDGILSDPTPAPIAPTFSPGGWFGTATTGPAGGLIRVVIPDYDSGRDHECRIVAPAGAPSAGDECLVVFDSRRDPWAIFPGVGP
jgi:hypothetical protein